MPITSVDAVTNVLNNLPASGKTSETEIVTAFKDFLSQAISNAEETTYDSAAFADALLAGEVNNLHDVTIAGSKAELAISLVVQIRDKLVDSYNDIIRMQV